MERGVQVLVNVFQVRGVACFEINGVVYREIDEYGSDE